MHVERAELELESLVARMDRRELYPRSDLFAVVGWNETRQQRFIDTILRDWCVPEIHVAADPTDPADREVVVDGGQRLLTLRRFFRDELTCAGGQAPDHDEVRSLDGLRFSDLPRDVRRRVRRFRMTVVVLSGYRPAELRELLVRLHPSSGPEIRIPLPRTPTRRAPASPEPIYDQVSAWFADRAPSQTTGDGAAASSADVARAASTDPTDATTADRPRALLVPGAVPPPPPVPLSFGPAHDPTERRASSRDGVADAGGDPPTDALPHPTSP